MNADQRHINAVAPTQTIPATWLPRIRLVVFLGLLVRVPTFFSPVTAHHGWRQTQTAWTIRQFARYGIDWLRPEVPIFGFRSQVVYEFPLFQAMASLLAKTGLSSVLAGRLTCLASFCVATWMTFVIGRKLLGARRALIGAAIFGLSPFSLYWSTSVMIDYLVLSLALVMVWAMLKWFDHHDARWPFVAAAVGSLVAAVKITTLMPWLIVVVAILVKARITWWKRISVLGLVAAFPMAVGVAWTAWADHVKSGSKLVQPLASAGVIAENKQAWLHLFSGFVWARPTMTIAGEQLGFVGVVALLLGLAVLVAPNTFGDRVKPRLVMSAVAVAPVLAVVMFPIQYGVHDYYPIAVGPSVALCAALGCGVVARFVRARVSSKARIVRPVIGVFCLLSTLFGGFVPLLNGYGSSQFVEVHRLEKVASEAASVSRPDEIVGVSARNWDPGVLYVADRNGIIDWSDRPESLQAWNAAHISTLIMISNRRGLLSRLPQRWIGARYPAIITLGDASDKLRGALVRSALVRPATASLTTTARMFECGREGNDLPMDDNVVLEPIAARDANVTVRVNGLAPIPLRSWFEIDARSLPKPVHVVCESDRPLTLRIHAR